jgi:hypothetical protein
MNLWEVAGMLVIIAAGVATGVNNLDVIARDRRMILEEIQGLRSDLFRESHTEEKRDPFE